MRMVVGPVNAKRTGTVSPTVRWSLFAVVVSMSSLPAASAFEVPDVMFRITVCARFLVPTASRFSRECRNSNWSA